VVCVCVCVCMCVQTAGTKTVRDYKPVYDIETLKQEPMLATIAASQLYGALECQLGIVYNDHTFDNVTCSRDSLIAPFSTVRINNNTGTGTGTCTGTSSNGDEKDDTDQNTCTSIVSSNTDETKSDEDSREHNTCASTTSSNGDEDILDHSTCESSKGDGENGNEDNE